MWCKEDEDGHLVDVAYRNSLTGLQLVGCGDDDWTSEATKVLLLTQDENIINVETCKGTPRWVADCDWVMPLVHCVAQHGDILFRSMRHALQGVLVKLLLTAHHWLSPYRTNIERRRLS